MNGHLAQLVALACHANWFLEHGALPSSFFDTNSSCKFCSRVSFVEVETSWLGSRREMTVAASPDAWFSYLSGKRASGVRVLFSAGTRGFHSSFASAGFVGGGGQWLLGVDCPGGTDYWMARWEVLNESAPDQRVWHVTYALVSRDRSRSSLPVGHMETIAAFESALRSIHAFSVENRCDAWFAERFARAQRCLHEGSTVEGSHDDLYVRGSLSPSSEAVLAAAQHAWVFGGMGSWSDMHFDGEKARQYEMVSEGLFTAMNHAICAATNESCRGSSDAPVRTPREGRTAAYEHVSTLALGVAKRVAAVVAAAGLTALALSWLAGVPYLFTLIGFACLVLVGHLATFDEDLPGGWSNPDGDRPFPWLELALKALTVVVLVVVALTVPTCRHLGAS